MAATKLEEKFEINLMKGEITTIEDFAAGRKKDIIVSPRKGETKEQTVKAMIDKMGQLVTLQLQRQETDPVRAQLRFHIKGYERMTKNAVGTLNHIFAMMRHRLQIPSDATAEEIEKYTRKLGPTLIKEHAEILANQGSEDKPFHVLRSDVQRRFLQKYIKKDQDGKIINDEFEFFVIDTYIRLTQMQKFAETQVKSLLTKFNLWNYCLKQIPGLGPIAGGKLIAYLDVHKAQYPGSFIRYCGATVEADGKATSKRREHNVPHEYIDKEGRLAYKWGTGHNAEWKAWLIHVLIPGFIMKRKNGNLYAQVYDEKKVQYMNRADLMKDKNGKMVVDKAHINVMAYRYTLKIFLIDLWLFWAALEGKEVNRPYHDKLGYTHHKGKPNWLWMVERLGDPMSLREELYGVPAELPPKFKDEILDYLKNNPAYVKRHGHLARYLK